LLKKINFSQGLIIVNELNSNLELASRNIPHIEIIEVNFIDPIKLLRHGSVLISEDSLPKLEELLV
jgi:large subunit ribosomal protein L4